MTENEESLKLFEVNRSDQIRIECDQRELKKFNDLNNEDISIDIISNSYLEQIFIINEPKFKDLTFQILPEITIFADRVVYHFFNIKEDISYDLVSTEKAKVFQIV